MKEVEFKEGDIVFWLEHGFGTVNENHTSHTITVNFGNNIRETFYLSGKYSSGDANRSLLTLEEAKLLGFEPEKKKKKVTMYQILTKGIGEYPTISQLLFYDELQAKEYAGKGFVKLLTDRPIEIEIDE